MYATYFTYILAQQPSSHTGTAMLTTGGNVFHSLSCVDESPFRNGSAALENVDDGGKMEALDSPAAATHPYCHIPVSPSLAEATKDQQQTKEIPSIEKDGKINIFTTLTLADFPLLPLPASQQHPTIERIPKWISRLPFTRFRRSSSIALVAIHPPEKGRPGPRKRKWNPIRSFKQPPSSSSRTVIERTLERKSKPGRISRRRIYGRALNTPVCLLPAPVVSRICGVRFPPHNPAPGQEFSFAICREMETHGMPQ